MAETLGSLHDKLSIANLRLDALYLRISEGRVEEADEKLTKLISLVRKQRDELDEEVHQYISDALDGCKQMKLEEPKYKIYQSENASGVSFSNIEDAILHLGKINKILWDLEDARRDKNKSDSEVRIICDEVARNNRIRNDMMDEVNRLFNESVKSRKT